MPKYLKSRFGAYVETDPQSCELIGYDAQEYRELKQQEDQLREYRRECQSLRDRNKSLEKKLDDAEAKVSLAAKRIEAVQKQADEKVAAYEQRGERLFRVMKERANADRGIRPKKQRSGYVLKISKQVRKRGSNRYFCWESLIQTPYPVEMLQSEIADLVAAGIADEYDVPYSEIRYVRDCKTGYWAVYLVHDLELKVDDWSLNI